MKVMIIAPPELHTHFGRCMRVAEKLEKPLRYLLYSMTVSVCAATFFGVRWSILTTRKERGLKSKEDRGKDRGDKIKEALEKMVNEEEAGEKIKKKKKSMMRKDREVSPKPTYNNNNNKSSKSGDEADPFVVRHAEGFDVTKGRDESPLKGNGKTTPTK